MEIDKQEEQVNLEKFVKKEEIGKGEFGKVFIVEDRETKDILAAKIFTTQFDSSSQEDLINISREVNNIAGMNHPAVVKFIGYSSTNYNQEPFPVIIMEYCKNGSLLSIIKEHDLYSKIYDDTKRLITIFGIASGMKYLHSNEIIHRDLKPDNILMDDYLFPKIADFGLSKKIHSNLESMTIQSMKGMKGTPLYFAPEIFTSKVYTKSSDVYAFGLILYVIMTNTIPFQNLDFFQVWQKVTNGHRPLFEKPVQDSYRNLIERCWSQDPNDRPTFDEIVNELKTNKEFITEKVKEEDYRCYIKFIEEYQSSFKNQKIINIEDYLPSNTFRKIDIRKYAEQPTKTVFSTVLSIFGLGQEKLYPADKYNKLNEKCQMLVVEAENVPEKQFYIGSYLIEGKNNFPLDIDLGVKYFERSIAGGNIDSILYLSRMLIDGKIISRDLYKAKKYLSKKPINDNRYFTLYGKILKKENKIKEARKIFEEGALKGESECMYEYAKLILCGECCQTDVEKAKSYFRQSESKGLHKSHLYLKILEQMSQDQSFNDLLSEIQHFFIKKIMKSNKTKSLNDEKIEIKDIEIKCNETEYLYSKESLDLDSFINILKLFESITIEISYPMKMYKNIEECLFKIKDCIPKTIVYLYISGIKKIRSKNEFIYDTDSGVKNIINIVNIGSSVSRIEKDAFFGCDSLIEIIIPSSVYSIGDKCFYGCKSLKQVSLSSSIKIIEILVFGECTSLTQISIPSSVTKIEFGAFDACRSLKHVSIPSSVTEIDNMAFKECTSLKEIEIPPNVKKIKKDTFYNCTSLLTVNLSNVEKIKKHAFYGCESLKRVDIPPSVKLIEEYAFGECTSLVHVSFSSSVNTIKNHAFSECESLKYVEVPSSMEAIDNEVFPLETKIVRV